MKQKIHWQNPTSEEEVKLHAIKLTLGRQHQGLLTFIFDARQPQLRLPPDELLKEGGYLSGGEYLLLQIALDIWRGDGNATLARILEIFSNSRWLHFFWGIFHLKGIPTEKDLDHA